MLNRFPAYFLLLGLACLQGYALRSGGTFSILSESIGPLVAEGNTSTTGFSQLGGTEAIQGTFSSATTGFSGTIGFLGQQNATPTNLNSTAPLTIAENQPVGTVVGEFNATDPDANSTLTYHLVSGSGDTHNAFFTLDANGTLKTSVVLDHESNASLSVRIRAIDENGASVEKIFTVTVSDEFAPIVGTHPQAESVSEGYRLSGEIRDSGGSAISERGFLLSTKPNPGVDSPGVIHLVAESNASAFSANATNLQAGKKYFFRAYATNAEGTGYGLEETFGTTTALRSPSWIDAVQGAVKDWWSSPWLGNFFQSANGWARHEKLGWVFPIESPTAGLWLWKEGFGWLWTNKEIYPFLYQNGNGGWLYFYGRRQATLLFYDYSAKRWITRNEGQ